MYSSTLSLTSALDGGGWSTPRLGRFTSRKRTGTHCKGGWVGPRAGLDRCGKSRTLPPSPRFDPPVQPLASRFTDRAIPGPSMVGLKCSNFVLSKQQRVTKQRNCIARDTFRWSHTTGSANEDPISSPPPLSRLSLCHRTHECPE